MTRKSRQGKPKVAPPASFGGVLAQLDGTTVELDANPGEGWQRVSVRQPLNDDWLCVYTIGNEAGVPVVSELRIIPRGAVPAGGVPARVLRKAKPATALAAAREALGLVNTFEVGVDDALETYYGFSAATLAPPPRQRNVERQRRLAEIAKAYVLFVNKNSPRPVEDVADLLERCGHAYSVGQVRNLVHDARRAGLLTPSPGRGLAGGELTEQAKELLADSEG